MATGQTFFREAISNENVSRYSLSKALARITSGFILENKFICEVSACC